jgi:hypothetical protein
MATAFWRKVLRTFHCSHNDRRQTLHLGGKRELPTLRADWMPKNVRVRDRDSKADDRIHRARKDRRYFRNISDVCEAAPKHTMTPDATAQ